MYNSTNKNEAVIVGTIASDLEYSHCAGSDFYHSTIEVTRKSGVVDAIPFIVSEKLKRLGFLAKGCRVCLKGQFRSYDERQQKKLKVFLLVHEASVTLETDSNQITIEGFICKQPYYKEVNDIPIAEVILVNNQKCGKEFFLPCIAWYENAKILKDAQLGTKVSLYGRIQSRIYRKITEDGAIYKKAIELSICSLRTEENDE